MPALPAAPYDIRSGLILTRPPLLTRKLHPFEDAFFFYQKRLEERLNTPFITSIYFKPDTSRQLDWNLKVKERRGTVAKELGWYHGKSSRAWDDELKVGDPLSDRDNVVDSLLKDAAARVSDDAEIIAPEDVVPVERPADRVTEADTKADVRRLDRQLERTLYLVVKGKDGWGFPADAVPQDENLHQVSRQHPALRSHDTYNSLGREKGAGTGRRRKHEHLDRRARASHAPRQGAGAHGRRRGADPGPEDLLPQGPDHGRPG